MKNNTSTSRITAAAGTSIGRSYFYWIIIIDSIELILQPKKSSSSKWHDWVKLPLIAQDSSLLPLIQSQGLVSVPMWLCNLSVQLSMIGLVCLKSHQLPKTMYGSLIATY